MLQQFCQPGLRMRGEHCQIAVAAGDGKSLPDMGGHRAIKSRQDNGALRMGENRLEEARSRRNGTGRTSRNHRPVCRAAFDGIPHPAAAEIENFLAPDRRVDKSVLHQMLWPGFNDDLQEICRQLPPFRMIRASQAMKFMPADFLRFHLVDEPSQVPGHAYCVCRR